MSHSNKIKDADAFFEVDAITRQIINKTPQKITLIQYDHNSERFTFALPRHIEGHDMAESAKAEVHFINIETGGANSHADKYEMNDLQPDPNDESKVICTWLISNNATQYAGRLAFMIRFACLDDNNNYVYVWNTATNEEISITNGMDNGAAMVDNYPDILAQWRQDVLGETAYLTDYFKQLPEGASLDDVKEPGNYIGYDNSGNYNGVQYNAPFMLFVGMHNYWNEEFQLEYPIECQTRIYCHPLDENAEHIIQRRMCDNNGWTDWEAVYATPGGEFRLLTEITADGETVHWTFTKDTDGSDLNVNEVYMLFKHAEASGYQGVSINGVREYLRLSISKGTEEYCYFSVKNKFLNGIVGKLASDKVMSQKTEYRSVIVSYDTINELKVGGYNTNALPTGTTIQIYVR